MRVGYLQNGGRGKGVSQSEAWLRGRFIEGLAPVFVPVLGHGLHGNAVSCAERMARLTYQGGFSNFNPIYCL